MAAGTLSLAILIFAFRGYFLGLPGAIARMIGVISAYFVAFSYRGQLATSLASNTDGGMHPIVLTAASSAILFFGTLFLVSFVLTNLFRVLARLIKPLRGILDKEALGSRIAGSLFNGAIGATLVLMGLWAYGMTLGKNQPADDLQRFANRFGDTLINYSQSWFDDESPPGKPSEKRVDREPETEVRRSTAEIVSTENPNRRLYLEKLQAVVQSSEQDPADWFSREQIAEMVNDPELRRQVKDYIESNPDAVVKALNNPKVRALLDQMENSHSND